MRRLSLLVTLIVLAGISFTSLPAPTESVMARTLYVGGGALGNYSTIQSAIDDAGNGDTVYVHAGTYRENVVINKTISLVGHHRETTTIDATDSGYGIHVTADWVNITGFTVTNTSWHYQENAGIHLDTIHDCWIADNNLSSHNHHGISVASSNNITITGNILSHSEKGVSVWVSRDVLIESNRFSENKDSIVASFSNDITIAGNAFVSQEHNALHLDRSHGNRIVNNNATNGWSAFDLSEADNNTISGNTLSDYLIAGIVIRYSRNNTVSGNSIFSNGWQGIYVSRSDNNTIVGNEITGNGRDGIKLKKCNNHTIEGNTISSNKWGGVYLQSSTGNAVIGNTISWNEGPGITLDSSPGNTVRDNTLVGNRETINVEWYWIVIVVVIILIAFVAIVRYAKRGPKTKSGSD
ncbi:MAG: right-handed parallel beta-helix repeat-containing protein [Thermoplasmata archaeon]|nr:right-handed parallel beta-helix repeat-containing protein [Thermoplasmata archaeon]